jgi:hypothetical protein
LRNFSSAKPCGILKFSATQRKWFPRNFMSRNSNF